MHPNDKGIGVNCRRPAASLCCTFAVLLTLLGAEAIALLPVYAGTNQSVASVSWKDFAASITKAQQSMMADPGAALASAPREALPFAAGFAFVRVAPADRSR